MKTKSSRIISSIAFVSLHVACINDTQCTISADMQPAQRSLKIFLNAVFEYLTVFRSLSSSIACTEGNDRPTSTASKRAYLQKPQELHKNGLSHSKEEYRHNESIIVVIQLLLSFSLKSAEFR
ncbi:unnamed protein product [Brugia timori]|uniref:Secreted protein n=1 Tax=Brugia timori TaxID=42155 RepID=A0A3P7T7M9_9BILA|nr:unnamed protein product [Brugia timori]